MLRRQLTVLCACLLLAGVLGYGLTQLFALRMGTGGDAHPAHSTLRADPLGAQALFDALNELPGVTARRNYQPLVRMPVLEPVALVYLGLTHRARWEKDELQHFEAMVTNGTRAIFAFQAVAAVNPAFVWDEEKEQADRKKKTEEAAQKAGKTKRQIERLLQQPGVPFAEAALRWGFKFKVVTRGRREAKPDFTARWEDAPPQFEPELPWHSELYFHEVQEPWKILYRSQGEPVVMERPWGRGSIVLLADSYLLSNEGLFDAARAPKLIASLFGTQSAVVFDEEHLGVAESSGVATLARKYRLHGLVAGLALVAALFVWQNIVRFVPPREDEATADALVHSRGSSEGFLALLRRSVPTGQLLATCLAEFRRTFTGDPRVLERLPVLPEKLRKEADLLAAYRAAAQSVHANPPPPSAP